MWRCGLRALRPAVTRTPAASPTFAFRLFSTAPSPATSMSMAVRDIAPVEKPLVTRFAVMELNGVQYKVGADDLICADRLPIEVTGKLKAERVLLVGERNATIIGSPLIGGASVTLTVEEQAQGDKQIVFKKRRRKNYRRWRG